MSCSTCDDYQLVPGEDGLLVPCLDCHPSVPRCPAHDVVIHDGLCGWCVREASLATALLERAHLVALLVRTDGC